ncbi:MAG: 50S ribosomal protein L25 [Candidatus Magasanikbacteria bacterium]
MTFQFVAKKREGKPEVLRAEGKLPGVLYGPEIEPISLEVDRVAFEKMYDEAGESSLIDLTIEGSKDEPAKVLVQEVVYDSIKQIPVHFDFRQIKMGVEMTATLAISFIGESQAVKEGGTLNTALDSLEIKCLPKDLIGEVEVDISALQTFEDSIHVKDIKLPEGIVVTDNKDALVIKVTPPLSDDQLKAMEESTSEVSEPVVEGEKKDSDSDSDSDEAVSDKDDDKKKEDKK